MQKVLHVKVEAAWNSWCAGGRTLDTNMDIVLLTLLDLAGVFIRFREGIDGFEVLLVLAKSMELF
jgi:hypothetical protein